VSQASTVLRCSFPPWVRWCSSAVLISSAALLFASLLAHSFDGTVSSSLLPFLLAALSFTICLNIHSFWYLRREHRVLDQAFRDTDSEFSSIFQHVLDGILIVDDDADCLDANPAAAAILRISVDKLIGHNIRRSLADCSPFAQKWGSFLQHKSQRGRARLIAGDGATLFVDFTAAANYLPGRHILIICDVTERTQAEMKIIEQLEAVEAAHGEAEALRKATLALSQNLAMDSALDTLLQCISELIPFDRATVLFVEDGFNLMIAREAPRILPKRIGLAFSVSANIVLQRVLFEKRATLLPDVAQETEWRAAQPLDQFRSWLGIPLISAGQVLGILSLGANSPRVFTAEHLRLAKSLAIPAAVAIQNARVHERAEIYAAELEARLRESREARNTL